MKKIITAFFIASLIPLYAGAQSISPVVSGTTPQRNTVRRAVRQPTFSSIRALMTQCVNAVTAADLSSPDNLSGFWFDNVTPCVDDAVTRFSRSLKGVMLDDGFANDVVSAVPSPVATPVVVPPAPSIAIHVPPPQIVPITALPVQSQPTLVAANPNFNPPTVTKEMCEMMMPMMPSGMNTNTGAYADSLAMYASMKAACVEKHFAISTNPNSGGNYGSMAGSVNHTWYFKDGSTKSSMILDRPNDKVYNDFIAGVDVRTRTGYPSSDNGGWKKGGGDQSNSQEFGIPEVSPTPSVNVNPVVTGGNPSSGGGTGSYQPMTPAQMQKGCTDAGGTWGGFDQNPPCKMPGMTVGGNSGSYQPISPADMQNNCSKMDMTWNNGVCACPSNTYGNDGKCKPASTASLPRTSLLGSAMDTLRFWFSRR